MPCVVNRIFRCKFGYSSMQVKIPSEILKKYWGYDQFRPRQLDIILAVMNGMDTLALLPTGGGKSICFQVPAMAMEGVCVVISPLLALMNDQVENLRKRKISAATINSAIGFHEVDRILDNCVYGDVKFLYVSPERLRNELFLERFKKMKVSFIAVDEAHCISQWGYDFRPDYLKIAEIRLLKPDVPVLALTASATPIVVKDIQHQLAFKSEHVIGTSFRRDNLSYNVNEQENKETKLIEICAKLKGSGIVYCGTRLRTKEIAALLRKNKMASAAYHAGMSTKEKQSAFYSWMKNETRIICATNAFGMGIDKPDVRFVVHVDVPAHPEAYFQEAGRAGRDGQKAYAVLLYNDADIERIHQQIDLKFPDKDFIRKVYKSIGNFLQLAPGSGKDIAYPFPLLDFCRNFELKYASTIHALQILELAGYVKLNEVAFIPSRLMFLSGRNDLYSYQVANPSMDPLIKILLRMYGGMFEQFVNIREDEIAKNTHLTKEEVMAKLNFMTEQKLMEYVSRSEVPLLTFLTGRMHEDSIILSPEIYENRKRRDLERANAMDKFVSLKHCRNVQLLEYFGELDVEPCGQCDVCRENKKHGLQPLEYEKINDAVMQLALRSEFTLDELPGLLPSFASDHLIEYARWKIDTGELVLNDKLFITIPGLENE